jgi:hypothetical protein
MRVMLSRDIVVCHFQPKVMTVLFRGVQQIIREDGGLKTVWILILTERLRHQPVVRARSSGGLSRRRLSKQK